MNKKPYYIQSGIVFLLIGTIFFLNAINAVLQTSWILGCVIGIIVVTVIYAIISSIHTKE